MPSKRKLIAANFVFLDGIAAYKTVSCQSLGLFK